MLKVTGSPKQLQQGVLGALRDTGRGGIGKGLEGHFQRVSFDCWAMGGAQYLKQGRRRTLSKDSPRGQVVQPRGP